MSPTRVTSPGAAPAPPSTSPQAPSGPGAAPASSATGTRAADTFATSSASARVFPTGAHRWGSWAWNTATLTAPAALEAALAFQKSAGASELYFNAYPLLGKERYLADVVARSSAAGLAPQLLLGSPEWIAPGTRPWLETSIVQPLKAVRAAVPATIAKSLAVHLDIEPHATGPLTPEKMRGYLDTLSWLGAKLGPGFALHVDIPSWYQGQTIDGKDFTREILARVEGVTLMAYGRAAGQVVAGVAPTLAEAARLGKQAMVAVEVGTQHASVGLGTQAEVLRFLGQLDAALAGKPGYGGCALHDLEKLKALPP